MFIKLFYRKIHFYHLELGKEKANKNNDYYQLFTTWNISRLIFRAIGIKENNENKMSPDIGRM